VLTTCSLSLFVLVSSPAGVMQKASNQLLFVKVICDRNLVPRSLVDEAEGEISPSASSTRDLGTRLI